MHPANRLPEEPTDRMATRAPGNTAFGCVDTLGWSRRKRRQIVWIGGRLSEVVLDSALAHRFHRRPAVQAQPAAVIGFGGGVSEQLSHRAVEELDGHPVAGRHRAVVKRHDTRAVGRMARRAVEQLNPASTERVDYGSIVHFGIRLIVEIDDGVAEDLDTLSTADEVRTFPIDLMKLCDKAPCS